MSSCCSDGVSFVYFYPLICLNSFISPNMGRVLIISTPFRRAVVVEFEDVRKFPFLKTFSNPVFA